MILNGIYDKTAFYLHKFYTNCSCLIKTTIDIQMDIVFSKNRHHAYRMKYKLCYKIVAKPFGSAQNWVEFLSDQILGKRHFYVVITDALCDRLSNVRPNM